MKNATNSCPCVLRHFHLGAWVLSEWGWGVSCWKVPQSQKGRACGPAFIHKGQGQKGADL